MEERLAGISDRGQGDERRQPVKEIARLRSHVGGVAGPHRDRQQHDVHGGKTRHREASQQPAGVKAFLVLHALGLERMGPVAEALDRADDLARLERVVAPIHGKPAIGEIEACVDDARQLREPALDPPDAAGAVDAFHRKVHVRLAALVSHVDREIERLRGGGLGHGSDSADEDVVPGSEHPGVVTRELNEEQPLTGGRVGRPLEAARRFLAKCNDMIRALVGRMHEARACGDTGQRLVCRIGRSDFERGLAGLAGNSRADVPVQRILRLGRGDVACEGEACLIGVLGLDAAEGRYRGPDHDDVDAGHHRKESDEADEHRPPRHLSRPSPALETIAVAHGALTARGNGRRRAPFGRLSCR